MQTNIQRPPLSVRSDPERLRAYYSPRVGVPSHLSPSLLSWCARRYGFVGNYGVYFVRSDAVETLERKAQVNLPRGEYRNLSKILKLKPATLLDAVDVALGWCSSEAVIDMQQILDQAMSEFTVGTGIDGKPELQYRVPPEIATIAEAAMSQGDAASAYLIKAWSAAYGLGPNPVSVCAEAVKAIEAAGKRAVSPRNDSTTLGTMIRDIKAAPQKWTTSIGGDEGAGVQLALRMMELVWTNHERHGRSRWR